VTLSRVDRLRVAYEAYNSGALGAADELISEDIEVRPPATSLEPEPFRGREALLKYLEPNLFEFQRAEPFEFLEEGDRLLVTVRVHARGSGSGVELRGEAFHLWTVEDELAVMFEMFLDRDEALAALRRP
jgi:ketosteroid isomerase-like protein